MVFVSRFFYSRIGMLSKYVYVGSHSTNSYRYLLIEWGLFSQFFMWWDDAIHIIISSHSHSENIVARNFTFILRYPMTDYTLTLLLFNIAPSPLYIYIAIVVARMSFEWEEPNFANDI